MKPRFFFLLFFTYILICSCTTQASKDPHYELNLGRNVAAIILGKYQQSTDIPLIRYVNLVGQSVASSSGRKDIHFHFTVIESDKPNALACPGGYVFVTTGLLKLIKNEAELAGVLAHEIAHINQKHVFNKVYEAPESSGNIFTQFLTAKNTSMSVAFSEISDQAITIIMNKGLDEADEFDADIAAVLYLQNTGYQGQAYLDLIARLPTQDTVHSKTHPNIDTRLQSIAAIFPQSQLNDGELLVDRYENHATLR